MLSGMKFKYSRIAKVPQNCTQVQYLSKCTELFSSHLTQCNASVMAKNRAVGRKEEAEEEEKNNEVKKKKLHIHSKGERESAKKTNTK